VAYPPFRLPLPPIRKEKSKMRIIRIAIIKIISRIFPFVKTYYLTMGKAQGYCQGTLEGMDLAEKLNTQRRKT
jgi:hypothetical protein